MKSFKIKKTPFLRNQGRNYHWGRRGSSYDLL